MNFIFDDENAERDTLMKHAEHVIVQKEIWESHLTRLRNLSTLAWASARQRDMLNTALATIEAHKMKIPLAARLLSASSLISVVATPSPPADDTFTLVVKFIKVTMKVDIKELPTKLHMKYMQVDSDLQQSKRKDKTIIAIDAEPTNKTDEKANPKRRK